LNLYDVKSVPGIEIMMDRKATIYALITILIWSSLAIAGSQFTRAPSVPSSWCRPSNRRGLSVPKAREWRLPFKTWLIGTADIFSYHFLIVTSFK
jgi:hypothetical protein